MQVRETVVQAIDCYRFQKGLSSDRLVAKSLNVSPKVISNWRNGKLTTVNQALVELLATARAEDATQAAGREEVLN